MVDAALEQLGYRPDFEIIGDIREIKKLGIKRMPALMVNGKIIFEGKVPSILDMPDILEKALK
ncbi:thioredoxin family protein [Dethiothermospora halolimnae]|uniref:thioredoxin family protein n=1 Tax=Dethiothermospora halolimnae TaxID=3114390 RepID=UPI003CCC0AF9